MDSFSAFVLIFRSGSGSLFERTSSSSLTTYWKLKSCVWERHVRRVTSEKVCPLADWGERRLCSKFILDSSSSGSYSMMTCLAS